MDADGESNMGNWDEAENNIHKIYQPLDVRQRQIRILHLHPGTGNSPLEGHLSLISIPHAQPVRKAKEIELEGLNLELKGLKFEAQCLQQINQIFEVYRREVWNKLGLESLLKELKDSLLSAPHQISYEENIKPALSKLHHYLIPKEHLSVHTAGKCATLLRECLDLMNGESNLSDGLHSQSKDEVIRPEIFQCAYEAVSYCWGSSLVRAGLTIQGHSLQVPVSALEALRNFRLPDSARALWIDSICINQNDVLERNQQVALMSDIYAGSARTLVWLGPTDDDVRTRAAIELVTAIAQQVSQISIAQASSELISIRAICANLSMPETYDLTLIKDMFNSQWFVRTWVWQEVAMSSDVICHIGKFSIAWKDVMITSFWCTHTKLDFLVAIDEVTISHMFLPTTMFMHGFKLGHKWLVARMNLSFIMISSKRSQATDPRDKVYALLGMTRWSLPGRNIPMQMKPNYNESTRNCIMNATRAMIVEDKDLGALESDLLDIQRGPGSKYESWPSWTPIWCETDGYSVGFNHHNADNGRDLMTEPLEASFGSDVLSLDGYEIDQISKVVPLHDYAFQPATVQDDFLTLNNLVTSETNLSSCALLFTLLAGTFRRNPISEEDSIIEELNRCLTSNSGLAGQDMTLKTRISTDSTKIVGSKSIDSIDEVASAIRWFSKGRQLFMTKQGRIGIGPKLLNENDKVTVLLGGRLPFILRKHGADYVLIGYAFVRGVMNGEAVEDMESRQVPLQSFDLR